MKPSPTSQANIARLFDHMEQNMRTKITNFWEHRTVDHALFVPWCILYTKMMLKHKYNSIYSRKKHVKMTFRMDSQLIRDATRAYMKSAATIYQITTNLWINSFEEIALPKATLACNVKVMIEIVHMLPELHQTQVSYNFTLN